MNHTLEQVLVENFPKIFEGYHTDPQTSAMSWGFEVDDGWYNIIYLGCQLIQYHLDWKEKQRMYLVETNHPSIPEPIPQLVATQVKEKFGTLRFYYDGGDHFTDGVVSMMESMSCRTCEVCGGLGTQAKTAWIKTLCKDHQ
jgi:hypothetical protein